MNICLACRKPLGPPVSTYPEERLCVDCHEEALENLACMVDKTYDRTAMNTGNRLWQALEKIYPPWEIEFIPPLRRLHGNQKKCGTYGARVIEPQRKLLLQPS